MSEVPEPTRKRGEVEEELLKEVRTAEQAWQAAKAKFKDVMDDVPSGLPGADGTFRISQARAEFTAAQERYAAVLKRFNKFILKRGPLQGPSIG